ncbi:hypothetical protein B0O80DRAFT_446155 [Mortierella sp. GBAus27b]|nr:hypothetical protein B0O80DRAFT_446153 [Mortierella sp. GBAus27b]KAI8356930.1 hypothetical protein B0O80DRAFT_446155 [Mortierella sp. GBAus27b]
MVQESYIKVMADVLACLLTQLTALYFQPHSSQRPSRSNFLDLTFKPYKPITMKFSAVVLALSAVVAIVQAAPVPGLPEVNNNLVPIPGVPLPALKRSIVDSDAAPVHLPPVLNKRGLPETVKIARPEELVHDIRAVVHNLLVNVKVVAAIRAQVFVEVKAYIEAHVQALGLVRVDAKVEAEIRAAIEVLVTLDVVVDAIVAAKVDALGIHGTVVKVDALRAVIHAVIHEVFVGVYAKIEGHVDADVEAHVAGIHIPVHAHIPLHVEAAVAVIIRNLHIDVDVAVAALVDVVTK